jgi:membrane protein YqaA with SNARE-associated domain
LGSFAFWLKKYLMLWGIPGLFGIAFIDAGAIPLVGGPDAAVLLLAWRRPLQAIPIVLAATLGSCLGYFFLYRIARFGGEMALSRFQPDRRAWIKRKLDQNAFFAIAAGVAAPPPFPTKLAILAAGAFNVGQVRFISGLLAGRLVRYSILAYLGARFGEQAISILKDHLPAILLSTLLVVAAILVARRFLFQAGAASEK